MSQDTKMPHPDEVRPPEGPRVLGVTELCANHPNLSEYIGQVEQECDALRAKLAAAETQIMVMRDEEAQRVKLKAIAALWDEGRRKEEIASRAAMESIGISTHWYYNAGKTVGAMVLELVEIVKNTRTQAPQTLREGEG